MTDTTVLDGRFTRQLALPDSALDALQPLRRGAVTGVQSRVQVRPSARAPQPGPFGVEEIEPTDLEPLLDEVGDGRDDTQLVDVRESWEAEIATLPGAILIPLGELANRLDELDRDRPVVTYCHAGMRSAQAAAMLTQAGFRARSLRGGIDLWSRAIDPDVPRY